MKIDYPIDWNEQEGLERPDKGWLNDVIVTLDNGDTYNLSFYDPVRLSQELEDEVEAGNAGVLDKGLMVIPSVTKTHIELAIKQAGRENYFD